MLSQIKLTNIPQNIEPCIYGTPFCVMLTIPCEHKGYANSQVVSLDLSVCFHRQMDFEKVLSMDFHGLDDLFRESLNKRYPGWVLTGNVSIKKMLPHTCDVDLNIGTSYNVLFSVCIEDRFTKSYKNLNLCFESSYDFHKHKNSGFRQIYDKFIYNEILPIEIIYIKHTCKWNGAKVPRFKTNKRQKTCDKNNTNKKPRFEITGCF